MKAQSDLMGDHENTAEMTVSRAQRGVTKWIAASDLSSLVDTSCDSMIHTISETITALTKDSPKVAVPEINFGEVNSCLLRW